MGEAKRRFAPARSSRLKFPLVERMSWRGLPAEVLRCGRDTLPLDMETLQANFPFAIEAIAFANRAMTDSVGEVTHVSVIDSTSHIWVVSL